MQDKLILIGCIIAAKNSHFKLRFNRSKFTGIMKADFSFEVKNLRTASKFQNVLARVFPKVDKSSEMTTKIISRSISCEATLGSLQECFRQKHFDFGEKEINIFPNGINEFKLILNVSQAQPQEELFTYKINLSDLSMFLDIFSFSKIDFSEVRKIVDLLVKKKNGELSKTDLRDILHSYKSFSSIPERKYNRIVRQIDISNNID